MSALSTSRRNSVFLFLLLAVAAGQAVSADPVMRETFDDSTPPSVLRERLDKFDNVALEPGSGPDGSTALRVVYRGNKEGSEGISESVPLGWNGTVASLSYDVKFADDFDFSRGGKLPGLGPEDPVTGGDPMRASGWSARPMWREDGLLTSYTYHQDKPEDHGDYARSNDFLLDRGRWHVVTVVVKLNSADSEKDGAVEIHIDGEKHVEDRGLRFWKQASEGPSHQVARLLFTTFHGGNDRSWAPRDSEGNFRDVVAWFDNVEIAPGRSIRKAPLRD